MIRTLALLALAAACSFAQTATRVDPSPVATTIGNVSPGGYPQLLAVPYAKVSVCNAPANGIPCTNYATTYTNATAATACANNAQVVVAGTIVCTATADKRGNFGFWILPGSYEYTVTYPQGGSYGPFPISVAAPGSPIAPAPTNAKVFGCKGDGATNDYACIVAAFASGQSLYFPAGSYLLNLTALGSPLILPTGNRSVTFDSGAAWKVTPQTNNALSTSILINGDANFTWNNVKMGLSGTLPTAPCRVGGPTSSYCTTMLVIDNTTNATLNNLEVTSAKAISLIAGFNANMRVNGLSIGIGAGTIFNSDYKLSIDHVSCTTTVWDDCLNVTSQAGTAGQNIANVHDLQVAGPEWASCLVIGEPNVTVSDIFCANAEIDGVRIENLATYAQTDTPDNILISNAIIVEVHALGHSGVGGYPAACIDVDGDIAMGRMTLRGITCRSIDGPGLFERNTAGVYSITLSDSYFAEIGLNTGGNNGACFFANYFTSFAASNNTCDTASGNAYALFGQASGGTSRASITGGVIRNVASIVGLATPIYLSGLKTYQVSGVDIVDDRTPASTYTIGGTSTVVLGSWSGINFDIDSPSGGNGFRFNSTVGNDVFSGIAQPIKLANVSAVHAPGNGSSGYCADCDQPPTQGSTCTSAGARTGAAFLVSGGVIKCY